MTSHALAASSQEVIFLDPDDDLGTVRAKLESTAADEVYLVIPRRASILRSPLEFRILSRMTNGLSSETIIVTGDGGRRSLARQEGLRTKRSVRSLSHLSHPPGARPWRMPSIPDWLPLPSFAGLLTISLLGAIVGGLVFFVLPIMRVTVSPQTISQKQDVEITVDSSTKLPDISRQVLPGETLQQKVEVVGAIPTTGTRKVGRDKARGEVVFVSDHPQQFVLPRASILVANNGARFQTDLEVQIPARSTATARVAVTAVESGTAGNVDAREITKLDAIPGDNPPPIPNIAPRNDRPTTGGTERDVQSVTAEDVTKLREHLQMRAREQGLAELYARAVPDKSLIQQSVRLRPENESFEPGVDAEAPQITGRLSVVATAMVFANAEFNGLIRQIFLAQVGPGYDLPMSQLGVGTPQAMGVPDQRIRLRTASEAVMVRQVNADDIAEQIRGKSPSEVRAVLGSLDGLGGAPRIEISPTWAPWAYRVEVFVK